MIIYTIPDGFPAIRVILPRRGLHIDNSDGFYLYVNGVHLGDASYNNYLCVLSYV